MFLSKYLSEQGVTSERHVLKFLKLFIYVILHARLKGYTNGDQRHLINPMGLVDFLYGRGRTLNK